MRTIIGKTILEFNQYHSPEAKARLISVDTDSFYIEFTGSFCNTCGFHDYFDDYKLSLEEQGVKSDITDIMEIEDGAVVKFTAS